MMKTQRAWKTMTSQSLQLKLLAMKLDFFNVFSAYLEVMKEVRSIFKTF
jgi:hypothetical protein